MKAFLILVLVLSADSQRFNDGVVPGVGNGPQSIRDMVKSFPYLSEVTNFSKRAKTASKSDFFQFAKYLESDGLQTAYLNRQITLFAPTNEAIKEWEFQRQRGRSYHQREVDHENLILNHMTNVAIYAGQLQHKLTSLVTGGPPLWITRHRHRTPAYFDFPAQRPRDDRRRSFDNGTGIYVNQAEIIAPDIMARSSRGDEQVLHVIDSVLEPLIPISLRKSEFFVNLDAGKLLSKSTLYDLDGHQTRVFHGATELNQRTQMFNVKGSHTFFLPVDTAFDVSVQLTGFQHDDIHNRGFSIPGKSSIDTVVDSSPVSVHTVQAI